MKNRILTDHERLAIRKYLETGERSDAVRVYISRARRSYQRLKEDLELIKNLIDHG